ncbi:uncharacterized protein LOC126687608 [Mercurialis annua]|uniref:uncharacterized protein LOC126687608 n=1 Tax=Mercurialis annua TaxID=3986 RepID=UPI0021601E5C|nr:uncharacterized protein LOC126687608 [Mercurialis annua]
MVSAFTLVTAVESWRKGLPSIALYDKSISTTLNHVGVKPIHAWNVAAVAKHVWNIVTLKATLWARWVIDNKLKRMSFWGICKPTDCSWSWNNLLKIRGDIIDYFEYNLGCGDRFSFWHDPWPDGKALKNRFPSVNIQDSEIPKDAKVNSLWRNGDWKLPDPIDEETQNAWDFVTKNFKVKDNEEDRVRWKICRNGKFYVKSLFEKMNGAHNSVIWHNLIWFPGHIPKFSFIAWLCLKRRILTKDKLVKWKVIDSDTCSLCGCEPENIDHLFFKCCFFERIWSTVLDIMGYRRKGMSWSREISFLIRRTSGRSKESRIKKLWFTTAVYYIWISRNDAIFNHKVTNPDLVFKQMKSVVEMRKILLAC